MSDIRRVTRFLFGAKRRSRIVSFSFSVFLISVAAYRVSAAWIDAQPPADPKALGNPLPGIEAPINLTNLEQTRPGDLTTGGYTADGTVGNNSVTVEAGNLHVSSGDTAVGAANNGLVEFFQGGATGPLMSIDGVTGTVRIGSTPSSSGAWNVDGTSAFYGTNAAQYALIGTSVGTHGVSSVIQSPNAVEYAIYGESTSSDGGVGVSGTTAAVAIGSNTAVLGESGTCVWYDAVQPCMGASWAGYFEDLTLASEEQFITSDTDLARTHHSATLFPDGTNRVLVVGGMTTDSDRNVVWLPADSNRIFQGRNPVVAAPALSLSRSDHTATALSTDILIAGGYTDSPEPKTATTSIERYVPDPVSGNPGSWTGTSTTLNRARARHTATLLQNGDVLIVGGEDRNGSGGKFQALSSIEVYRSATDTVELLPLQLSTARTNHTATLLSDGRVLIVGGQAGQVAHTSTEIIDPGGYLASDFSSTTGPTLVTGRANHTATLLDDGRVLIAGGIDESQGNFVYHAHHNTSEVYVPSISAGAVGSIAPGPALREGRSEHTANLLPNGDVLLLGGEGENGTFLDTSEIVNVFSNTSEFGPDLAEENRKAHTTTILHDGAVLVVGGTTDAYAGEQNGWSDGYPLIEQNILNVNTSNPESSTYDGEFSDTTEHRADQASIMLTDGTILNTGGQINGFDWASDSVLYEPDPTGVGTGMTITSTDPNLQLTLPSRSAHTITPTATLFSWWDPSYLDRLQFQVTNPSGTVLPAGYQLNVPVYLEDITIQDTTNRDDLRVVRRVGVPWQEIPRDIVEYSTVPPHSGYASFDAATLAYLEVAHTTAFESVAGSIEFWFRIGVDDLTQTFGLLSKETSGQVENGQLSVVWDGTANQLVAHIDEFSPGPTRTITAAPTDFNLREWNHAAFVWDSSNAEFFVNGISRGTAAHTTGTIGNDLPLNIGADASLGSLSAHLGGMIDDLRWSNVRRDISTRWNNGVYENPVGVDANTVAYWPFNVSFDDASGNGFHATSPGNAPSIKTSYRQADVWFATQQNLNPGATDSNYYLYFNKAAPWDPPLSIDPLYIGQDAFDTSGDRTVLEANNWHVDLGGALEVDLTDDTQFGYLYLSHDGLTNTATVTVEVLEGGNPVDNAQVDLSCTAPTLLPCDFASRFPGEPTQKFTNASGIATWTFEAPDVTELGTLDGDYDLVATVSKSQYATTLGYHTLDVRKPPLLLGFGSYKKNLVTEFCNGVGEGSLQLLVSSEGQSISTVSATYETTHFQYGECTQFSHRHPTMSDGQNIAWTVFASQPYGWIPQCTTTITATKNNYQDGFEWFGPYFFVEDIGCSWGMDGPPDTVLRQIAVHEPDAQIEPHTTSRVHYPSISGLTGFFKTPVLSADYINWSALFDIPQVHAQQSPAISVNTGKRVQIDTDQYQFAHIERDFVPTDFSPSDGIVVQGVVDTDSGAGEDSDEWGNGIALYWDSLNWGQIRFAADDTITATLYDEFTTPGAPRTATLPAGNGFLSDTEICLQIVLDDTDTASPFMHLNVAHTDANGDCRRVDWLPVASWDITRQSGLGSAFANDPAKAIFGKGTGTVFANLDNNAEPTGNYHTSYYLDDFLARNYRTQEPMATYGGSGSGGFYVVTGGHGEENNTGGPANLKLGTTTWLFSPDSGTNGAFAQGPDLTSGRTHHTATLLNDGRILIAGGYTSTAVGASATRSTELYDPSTNTFTPGPDLPAALGRHAAARAADGTVIVMGGTTRVDDFTRWCSYAYTPDTGIGSFGTCWGTGRRAGHSMLALSDNRLMMTGGRDFDDAHLYGGPVNGDAKLYELSGPWGSYPKWKNPSGAKKSMNIPREGHVMVQHPETGDVYIFGGRDQYGFITNTVEIFDLQNETFLPNPPSTNVFARADATVFAIPGGSSSRLLLSHGLTNNPSATAVQYLNPISWVVTSNFVVESDLVVEGLNANRLNGLRADQLVAKGSENAILVAAQEGTPPEWSPQTGHVHISEASSVEQGLVGIGSGVNPGIAGYSTVNGESDASGNASGIRAASGSGANQAAVLGIAGAASGGGESWAGYFEGTVGIGATGTAPFTLTGTTGTVANLNADLLDGEHATAFLQYSDLETLLKLQSGAGQEGNVAIDGIARVVNTSAPSADAILGYAQGSLATGIVADAGGLYGRGQVTTGGQTSYGVYATSQGFANTWAGYFAGDVYVGGDLMLRDGALSVSSAGDGFAGGASLNATPTTTVANEHVHVGDTVLLSLRSTGDAPADTTLYVSSVVNGAFSVTTQPTGNQSTTNPILFDYFIVTGSSAVGVQSFCGDEVIENAETCDITNLGGNDCTTLGQGFNGGTLRCHLPGTASECTFDTTSCTSPSGSGSCPYIAPWDGTQYVLDNDIYPAATGQAAEYVDWYPLSKPLVPKDGAYELRVTEIPEERSFTDHLALTVVDHPAGYSVATDPDGVIHAYRDPVSPSVATDGDGTNVLEPLQHMDGEYVGYEAGGTVTMEFPIPAEAETTGARLVLRTDALTPQQIASKGPIEPLSLHLEVPNGNDWVPVSNPIHPHALWDAWVVDVSSHLPENGDSLTLKVRWTEFHKLDFVGIDATAPMTLRTTVLAPDSAWHSRFGEQRDRVLVSDDWYLETVYGDEVIVRFPATLNDAREGTRTFILQSEGYYEGYVQPEITAPATFYNVLQSSPYLP